MSEMFKHILVPVDFTEKNDAALSVARQLALQHKAILSLLHVIEKVDIAEDEQIRSFYDDLRDRADTNMDQMADRLGEAGVEAQREILFGHRGSEIVRFAMEHEVDLVVLSSHKVSLESAASDWDTLSYQASVFCQCSVLLVKE